MSSIRHIEDRAQRVLDGTVETVPIFNIGRPKKVKMNK